MRTRPALRALLAALLGLALACVYHPRGRCDAASDCAATETCSAGVCVPVVPFLGVDPSSAPTVVWTLHAGQAATAFAVDGAGADLAGNVVVGGTCDAAFSFGPDAAATGAFAARLAAADGAAAWVARFPTFAHGRFGVAALPGTGAAPGDVLFAGAAQDPTAVGTHAFTPGARGALVLGRLDGATGAPVWARAVANGHATLPLAPVSVAVLGGDLLLAGTGAGSLGAPCPDPDLNPSTGPSTFVARLDGATGACRWVRWLGTQALAGAAPGDDGRVAVAGLCAPVSGAFDPGGGTTCARGLFVASLDGDALGTGATRWARASAGAGTVASVRGVAAAPDGRATVVGEAQGAVDLGAGAVDFGALSAASFAATWGATGALTAVVRPVEAPYAADPDAALFARAAYDRAGRLWLGGRYLGAPRIGAVRFTPCRAPCAGAAFLARLDAAGEVGPFLSLRARPDAGGGAFVDDLALFVTTGSVSAALHLRGDVQVGGAPAWVGVADDLAVLRAIP